MTTDDQCELVRHCIGTQEFLTIKVDDRHLLLHQNAVKHSAEREWGLELPPNIIRKAFGPDPLSIMDATSTTCHVDPSLYDIIVFADKSAMYTRSRPRSPEKKPPSFEDGLCTPTELTSSNVEEALSTIETTKPLPFYVHEDLEMLERTGMSKEEIDRFVRVLDDEIPTDIPSSSNEIVFVSSENDHLLQRIIDFTDITTRLRCRQVSRKWKTFVDRSTSWHSTKLSRFCRHIDRALIYFEKVNIRELDLSQSLFEQCTFELKSELFIFSLRLLCIATDQPWKLFILLFRVAPFLQHIKLSQKTFVSSKSNNNQLYDCVNFVICQCQQRLKFLRRLHIQLRSASDQIFLESSSVTSIPISYEVITS